MGQNFKPTFWSKYCQTELKKDLVMGNWCDYKYEGEIKKGAKLKIVGAVRPTIFDYVKGQPFTPEDLSDNSQYLEITEAKAFAFLVDDIDKAQSKEGYLETQFDESKEALAEESEKFVGSKAQEALASMTSASTAISENNSLTTIDDGLVALYGNGVSATTPLAADLCPKHIVKAKAKLNTIFQDNNEYVKNGAVGKYGNVYLRMANCLFNDGTDYLEMIRTKKAIAFANQINEVKHTDNTYGFGEIIKGLHVYGAKLVRPKELYVIKAH